MENKNKPAFPNLNSDGYATAFHVLEDKTTGAIGLTKREYFAAMAMQGVIANPSTTIYQNGYSPSNVAMYAIQYADELLKQLDQ